MLASLAHAVLACRGLVANGAGPRNYLTRVPLPEPFVCGPTISVVRLSLRILWYGKHPPRAGLVPALAESSDLF